MCVCVILTTRIITVVRVGFIDHYHLPFTDYLYDIINLFTPGVMENHNNIIDIDITGVHTNIVMIDILKPGLTAEQFCQRLKTVRILWVVIIITSVM